MASHLFDVRSIHLFKIGHALKKDIYVDDVLQVRSDGFESWRSLYGLTLRFSDGV